MKRIYVLFLLLSVQHINYSQYVKTLDITFKGGNNGTFKGNLPSDVVCTIDSTAGALNVAVNKVDSPLSALWFSRPNCLYKTLVFDQQNRFMEFRIKCDLSQKTPMVVKIWGKIFDECKGENKTWPENTFTIPEANVWKIVLLKVPPTTGGTQNIIDTVGDVISWALENGHYSFDYVKMGIGAIPPKPTIDSIGTKKVYKNGTYNLMLTGISIPDRLIDGLTIQAAAKSGKTVIHDLSIVDSAGTPLKVNTATNIATATIQFIPDTAAAGMSDSIIITLKDTIRNTTTQRAFKVSVTNCICDSAVALPDPEDIIKVFPNPTSGIITLKGDNVIKTEIFDITGGSQGVYYGNQIDLGNLAGGMYILNIYGKDGFLKKEKIIISK